jgi:hypothetical protein
MSAIGESGHSKSSSRITKLTARLHLRVNFFGTVRTIAATHSLLKSISNRAFQSRQTR